MLHAKLVESPQSSPFGPPQSKVKVLLQVSCRHLAIDAQTLCLGRADRAAPSCPPVPRRRQQGCCLLAVDSRPAAPEVAAEATKVRIDADRIIAIGKDLAAYDALDTGMFVCAPSLFAAIDASRAAGNLYNPQSFA